MKKVLLCLIFLAFVFPAQTAVVKDTLYINAGIDTLYSQGFYFRSFNATNVFSRRNVSFKVGVNDTLQLVVINNDTLLHNFTIDSIITSSNTVLPGDTLHVQFKLTTKATYRYYSSTPYGANLGASGLIGVGYETYTNYQWNLFDQDSSYSSAFHQSLITSIDTGFRPAIFLINGFSYPQTSADSTVDIETMMGDTVFIHVLNSGHMVHTLHFHGFHVKIVTSSHTPQMVNWIKDSFPVYENASYTLMLVPDKDGEYPIHDHNLIASTNAGMYPGGMMAMMHIMP